MNYHNIAIFFNIVAAFFFTLSAVVYQIRIRRLKDEAKRLWNGLNRLNNNIFCEKCGHHFSVLEKELP